jgi:hypothetical protein
MRWVEWQAVFDPVCSKGSRAYWRNTSFDRFDQEVIDVLVGREWQQIWAASGFDVHHMGGAFGRVGGGGDPVPEPDRRGSGSTSPGSGPTRPTTTTGSSSCAACPRTWSRSRPGPLRQLPGPRAGRAPRLRPAHGLRAGEVSAAGRGEAALRPRGRFPRQPEHPPDRPNSSARWKGCGVFSGAQRAVRWTASARPGVSRRLKCHFRSSRGTASPETPLAGRERGGRVGGVALDPTSAEKGAVAAAPRSPNTEPGRMPRHRGRFEHGVTHTRRLQLNVS